MQIRSSHLRFTPSAAALGTIETCARDLAPQSAELSAWHNGYLANHKIRIAHDLDIINREIPKSKTIMEFGSIPLVLTAALKSCGYQVTGCDIAPERYASTIEAMGLAVVKCNIETQVMPFADESFDAVIFNELFEHLRINPVFTLTEVLRIMRPNGILTLSTPNLRSLDGIRNFLLRDKLLAIMLVTPRMRRPNLRYSSKATGQRSSRGDNGFAARNRRVACPSKGAIESVVRL